VLPFRHLELAVPLFVDAGMTQPIVDRCRRGSGGERQALRAIVEESREPAQGGERTLAGVRTEEIVHCQRITYLQNLLVKRMPVFCVFLFEMTLLLSEALLDLGIHDEKFSLECCLSEWMSEDLTFKLRLPVPD